MQTATFTGLRWMLRGDLARVLEIERLCFQFPWSAEDLEKALHCQTVVGNVAEQDGVVVGFMLYHLLPTHLDVLTIAVDPAHVGQGVGHLMAERLKSKLHPDKRNRLRVMVRESNTAALCWWRRQGLLATEIVPQPYRETSDDGIVMEYFA